MSARRPRRRSSSAWSAASRGGRVRRMAQRGRVGWSRSAPSARRGGVRRVIGKRLDGAPHETLITIDATTGQNGLRQAQAFSDAVEVSGVVLTKLDGTAKGGITLAIAKELETPVKLIGIGETLEDLRP